MQKTNFENDVRKAVSSYGKFITVNEKSGMFFIYKKPTQYSGCVYWIHVDIKDVSRLKSEYGNVTGFNIMPYQITRDVVNRAVPSNPDLHKFCEQPDGFCDFDVESGNFHVKTNDINLQIVLTERNSSPLWNGEVHLFNDQSIIKTHYYFPRIDDLYDVPETDDLTVLIGKVLKEIGVISDED